MLIGFTGAQCTGKTTLLNMCKTKCTGGWNFVDEVTRKVKRERSVMINEDGDDLTQLFILKEHLTNHVVDNDDQNWILDRCILDGYVFTKWLHVQGSVERWVLDHAACLLSMLGERLDLIFYTEPEDIIIEDDGERSVNKIFRDDIISIYEDVMASSMSTPGRDTWRRKVVRLSGDVETRMKTIYQHTNNLDN